MTDPVPPVPAAGRSWTKPLLVVSLAVNLAVAGLAAGAYLRDGGGGHRSRDLDLGPLAEALDRSDRRALRETFLERNPDLREGRAKLRADFDGLLAALRAEPFDPAALDAALAAMNTRNADRLAAGRAVIGDYLKGLTAEARKAFADRLAATLDRRGRLD